MNDSFGVLDSLLSSNSPESEVSIISLSRYLVTMPLSESNFEIYAKILHRNIAEAADVIFFRRKPSSFFTVLPANKSIISFALSTLSDYKYSELYSPIAGACLGICNQCFGRKSQWMELHRLSVAELYHIGKYLMVEDEEIEDLILEVLEYLSSLSNVPDLAGIAGKIMDHALDHSKSLSQIIPSVVLSP